MAAAKKTAAKKPATRNLRAKTAKADVKAVAPETFVERAREALEDRAEQVTATFKNAWEQVGERFQGVRTGAEDALGVVRSSVEIAGQGVRDVNLAVLDMIQGDVTRFLNAQRKTLKAESLKDALEIQGEFVREEIQHRIKNVRVLSEKVGETARDAFAPIRDGVTDLVEKAGLRKAA